MTVNIPVVPTRSAVLDKQGYITPEWAYFFREMADFARLLNDLDVRISLGGLSG